MASHGGRGKEDAFPKRPIETVASKDGEGQVFSVVTYNVLSDRLLHENQGLYPAKNSAYLPWSYRKDRLIREILAYNAEIVCVQELDYKHFVADFLPKLQERWYDGMYMSKTGSRSDGCALFYDKNVFTLVGQRFVEYKCPSLRVLDRDNVALLAMLQTLVPGPSGRPELLCVATTHILFNHNRGDVKLAQIMLLLAEAERFATIKGPSGDSVMMPIVFAGDFNSLPNSPLYQLMARGYMSYGHSSAKSLDGEYYNCDPAQSPMKEAASSKFSFLPARLSVSNNCRYQAPSVHCSGGQDTVRHSMRLKSVHECRPDDRDGFTTRHLAACGVVDYVFYASQSHSRAWHETGVLPTPYHRTLRLVQRRRLMNTQGTRNLGMLPNDEYSSDHLALQAFFQFTDPMYERSV